MRFDRRDHTGTYLHCATISLSDDGGLRGSEMSVVGAVLALHCFQWFPWTKNSSLLTQISSSRVKGGAPHFILTMSWGHWQISMTTNLVVWVRPDSTTSRKRRVAWRPDRDRGLSRTPESPPQRWTIELFKEIFMFGSLLPGFHPDKILSGSRICTEWAPGFNLPWPIFQVVLPWHTYFLFLFWLLSPFYNLLYLK